MLEAGRTCIMAVTVMPVNVSDFQKEAPEIDWVHRVLLPFSEAVSITVSATDRTKSSKNMRF